MGRSLVLEGSCHCGAVRFEVTEDFSTVRVCHCTTCKKLSGGVGTTNGRVRTEAIKVVQGRELIRTYQPGEGSTKSFCSQCGSNLFGGGWPESEESSVRISAIDSPFERKPEGHTWVRSVAAWEILPDDGTPRYETSVRA
jgi:hypothetical protein